MLERDIEKALCDRVKELGGLCEKFTSPNRKNVPDRIVTLEDRIIFVELKAPNKKPTKAQERDHKKRRNLGCDVRVINSVEAVNAFPN
jgi:hypothetical protein